MVGQPFAAKGPHEKCKALRVFWHNFRDLGKNNLFFLFYERFLQFEVWSKNGFVYYQDVSFCTDEGQKCLKLIYKIKHLT